MNKDCKHNNLSTKYKDTKQFLFCNDCNKILSYTVNNNNFNPIKKKKFCSK